MMNLLFNALGMLQTQKEQAIRVKALEASARGALQRAYEDTRYPHQIEGELAGDGLRANGEPRSIRPL